MACLSDFVIKHKKFIVYLFILLSILCVFMQLGVSVNYDLTAYLPEDAQSTKALAVLDKEFNDSVPNASVMIKNVSIAEALEYKSKLKEIQGVSSVLWLDDVIDLKVPLETADVKTVEAYYKNRTALFSLTIKEGYEKTTVKELYNLIGESNAISGEAIDTATVQNMAVTESTRAMVILVPIIIIILLLTTTAWIEPLLFLLAIGCSVLINMGTNLFFGEISFITQAVSPILQMAVSLDYAIFLLKNFNKYRKETDDVNEAMKLAMKRSLPAVAASALTTLFGFLALTFMNFRIGSDLGINLVKGILLSFISVMIFLPAVTLYTFKLIDKTQHKRILPEFKNAGKRLMKIRFITLALVIILIIPSYLAQKSNTFIYGMGSNLSDSRSGDDAKQIQEEFGSSVAMVLLVPKDQPSQEEALCRELKKIDEVSNVISYAATVGTTIPPDFPEQDAVNMFYSENYARIILYADTENEGEEAFEAVEKVQSVARQYYGDNVLSCGQSINLYDVKNVVEKDTPIVNGIAVIAIALVLLVTFKTPIIPLLLLLTIETSIWINLAVPYFYGDPLCYIGFLVISTVQLGATVDYAILFTDHYRANRKRTDKKESIKETFRETMGSILISGSILAAAGFTLYLVSHDRIISELGLLLGRGTVLSVVMVLSFLPTLLMFFDKITHKTTLHIPAPKGGKKDES